MNIKIQKTIDDLHKLVSDLTKSNEVFRQTINERVDKAQKIVDAKHHPINFEQEILQVAQLSITKAIESSLASPYGPLQKLVDSVISEYSGSLKTIMSEGLGNVIDLESFKKSIADAFCHKIARRIVSSNDAIVDSFLNDMKSDMTLKAKMTLALSNVLADGFNRATTANDE